MKDKKNLYPVLLLFITAISIYYLIQFRNDAGTKYDYYLSEARKASEGGVESTALEYYQQAISLNPSDALSYEVGQMYLLNEDYWNAKRWYEREMLPKYPQSPLTYKLGIEQSIAREDYSDLFEIYVSCKEQQLSDENIEALVEPFENEFKLSGSYAAVGGFSNIVAYAPVFTEFNGWEYIDIDGSSVISKKYQKAGVFSQFAAIVDEKGKPFFIDKEGNSAISGSYLSDANDSVAGITEFRDYSDDLILAQSESGWGYYDSKSYKLKYGHYADATPFSNGVSAVTRDAKKWALLAKDGNEISGYDYDSIVSDFKGFICRTDAVIVEKAKYYYLIDKEGKAISNQRYGRAKAFNDATLAAVNKEGKWLFVNSAGEEKDLGDFQEVESFSNGLAAVKNNGMWGFIDMEGNLVIDYQFEETTPMSKYGTAFVKKTSGKWALLRFYYYKYNK